MVIKSLIKDRINHGVSVSAHGANHLAVKPAARTSESIPSLGVCPMIRQTLSELSVIVKMQVHRLDLALYFLIRISNGYVYVCTIALGDHSKPAIDQVKSGHERGLKTEPLQGGS